MNNFMDTLQEKLIPISDKISKNKLLSGISGGFAAMLPVVMVGAIFSLLANLNISFYQNLITSIGLKQYLAIPVDYTTNMISLYAVFLIGKASAETLGMDNRNSVSAGLISLMTFLILTPLGASATDAGGTAIPVAGVVRTYYFGSAGLFTAMLLGIVIPRIYAFLVKHNLTIKMPESVPPAISKSFTAMVPALIIGAIAIVLRVLCGMTSYGTMTDMLYGMLRAPLGAMAASPITFIILLLVCNILWFFGIHGGMVATSIMSILYTPFGTENLSAFAAGTKIPNIIIGSAWGTIGNIGGSGCAIGLCLAMFLFAKSSRYKALSKISLPAGICGISEPMVFGVPMVLNPILLIPMLIVPIITFLLGFLAMKIGLVPYLCGVGPSLGTPLVLYGFLSYASWKGALLQVVLIAVSTACWYPFFRIVDRQALAEENAAAAEE
ncbi:MAG: PTS sugar transporter subunit IIC [Solobacterium sp.]|nr:PTS sugar transporter subunit IIC [Solobacterium sp.]